MADDATIQRIVALLTSHDTNENKNGATLVINTAANSHAIPKLLAKNVVSLLLPKLNSPDNDLVMKACWGVNNLCVNDEGRSSCYKGGVLKLFEKVLQRTDPEVIKKACWALTNLARNTEAQKDIVKGPVFTGLVNILNYGSNDEEKGYALQPLCNLVLDANNQLAFKNAGGIPSVSKLLASRDDKTQELAITLVSFVTTNHDSIRNDLVNSGVLPPLCVILNGAKNVKLTEYALNSLVNLSLSEHAEKAIHTNNAVRPVVGLLSSEDPRLAQQAAMVLSNLLTNKDIRESIRYLGWVDPIIKLLKSGDQAILQQVIRVIINICFDEPCRYQLQKAEAAGVINSATRNVADENVFKLTTTAIKNLSVPVSAMTQNEVNQKLQSGGIERVHAPKPVYQQKTEIDSLEVDNLLKGFGHSAKPAPSHQAQHHNKPQPKYNDDLDDLLGNDYNSKPVSKPPPAVSKPPPAVSKPPPKPTHNYDDIDDLLGDVTPSKPAVKAPPPGPKSNKKDDLYDIDDLLSGINDTSISKKPNPPSHKSAHDDIDDLLAGYDTGPKSKPPPPKPAASKPPPPPSHHHNDYDDIDDLLDNGPSHHHRKKSESSDDLLDYEKENKKGYRGGGGGGGGDDIDDLLSGYNDPPKHKKGNASGLDAIDDLLADLTG